MLRSRTASREDPLLDGRPSLANAAKGPRGGQPVLLPKWRRKLSHVSASASALSRDAILSSCHSGSKRGGNPFSLKLSTPKGRSPKRRGPRERAHPLAPRSLTISSLSLHSAGQCPGGGPGSCALILPPVLLGNGPADPASAPATATTRLLATLHTAISERHRHTCKDCDAWPCVETTISLCVARNGQATEPESQACNDSMPHARCKSH